jgi:peptidoglycan LD-endopeptidase LytH
VGRRITGDGRVLLLSLLLSGSALTTLPGPGPAPAAAAGTQAELQWLAAQLTIPVAGVRAAELRDDFNEMRGTRRHEALDIPAARGTPVVAAAAGRVLQISSSATGGRMVFAVDASERFLFLYAHLDGYAEGLTAGMPLRRGQLLGYVGTSGNAPAGTPHLHFAIKRAGADLRWSRGTAVDPRPLFLQQPDPDAPVPDDGGAA